MSGGGWGRVTSDLRAKGVLPKKRTSNQHSDLCARRGGKTQPCTCGAAERSKALERELLRTLTLAGIPPDRSDLVDGAGARFIPDRLFRADALYLAARLVVEVQGWAGGGRGPHGGVGKMLADVEKHSLAAAHGWRCLPVTAKDIRSGAAVRLVLGALAWRTTYGTLPPAGPAPALDARPQPGVGALPLSRPGSGVAAGPGGT